MARLNSKMVNSPLNADNPFKVQSDMFAKEFKIFNKGRHSDSMSNREGSIR